MDRLHPLETKRMRCRNQGDMSSQSKQNSLFFVAVTLVVFGLLAYAFRTGKPIFIAGMLLGPFLYGRSLMLCYRRA